MGAYGTARVQQRVPDGEDVPARRRHRSYRSYHAVYRYGSPRSVGHGVTAAMHMGGPTWDHLVCTQQIAAPCRQSQPANSFGLLRYGSSLTPRRTAPRSRTCVHADVPGWFVRPHAPPRRYISPTDASTASVLCPAVTTATTAAKPPFPIGIPNPTTAAAAPWTPSTPHPPSPPPPPPPPEPRLGAPRLCGRVPLGQHLSDAARRHVLRHRSCPPDERSSACSRQPRRGLKLPGPGARALPTDWPALSVLINRTVGQHSWALLGRVEGCWHVACWPHTVVYRAVLHLHAAVALVHNDHTYRCMRCRTR